MKHDAESRPAGPDSARRVLEWLGCGDVPGTLTSLSRYVAWLRDEGIPSGAIGPHEHDRLWDRHIADALTFGLDPRRDESLLDVGTGAGLPGMPLAAAFPAWRCVLVDRSARRCDLVERAAAVLGLSNVTVLNRDVDDVEGTFDRVVMRAVLQPEQAIDRIAARLSVGGIGLLGIARDSEVAVNPPVGTKVVLLPDGLFDGGVRLLRIAPRGVA